MLYLDGGEDQISLADRAINPTKKDVSRLHAQWRKTELGDDNGKSLFDRLEVDINTYNDTFGNMGGHAKLQRFERTILVSETESEDDSQLKKPRNI